MTGRQLRLRPFLFPVSIQLDLQSKAGSCSRLRIVLKSFSLMINRRQKVILTCVARFCHSPLRHSGRAPVRCAASSRRCWRGLARETLLLPGYRLILHCRREKQVFGLDCPHRCGQFARVETGGEESKAGSALSSHLHQTELN